MCIKKPARGRLLIFITPYKRRNLRRMFNLPSLNHRSLQWFARLRSWRHLNR